MKRYGIVLELVFVNLPNKTIIDIDITNKIAVCYMVYLILGLSLVYQISYKVTKKNLHKTKKKIILWFSKSFFNFYTGYCITR